MGFWGFGVLGFGDWAEEAGGVEMFVGAIGADLAVGAEGLLGLRKLWGLRGLLGLRELLGLRGLSI